MRYSIIFFCCVFLMACKERVSPAVSEAEQTKPVQQRTSKPGAAVQLQHRLSAPVELAQPVTIELQLSSASPEAQLQVQLKLDDNLSLLSDRSAWQLTLAAGNNPATLPVEVALQSGEQGYIHVFVAMTTADGDRTRSFVVPVRLASAANNAAEKSTQKNPGVIEMPAEEKIY